MTRPQFSFGTKPYEHQATVFDRTRDDVAYGYFLDMGCGKSKIFIDVASWLYCGGKVNGVLLLAPKGVYGNWSDAESGQFVTHLCADVRERSRIFKWSESHATKKFQAAFEEFLATDPDDLAVFVVNCEALTSKSAVAATVAFLKSRAVIMGVDEATFIKTPDAQVTQKTIKLGRGARYRRVLTGTPVTNSPLDVYSLYEFLDPAILGYPSFFAFRNRYAILHRQQMGPRAITVVRGFQRQDELRERMERGCVIMRKEDCLDLPEKVYETRDVQLSPNQLKLYNSMLHTSLAELEQGGAIVAQLALTKLLRLHQITLGFATVEREDGTEEQVEIDPDGGPRARELLRVVEEIGPDEKLIVWANYTYNIRTISRLLRERYDVPGANRSVVGVYDGSTVQEDREEIVRRFQDVEDPLRFFVGHTKTGGFGLTLTAAANTVYLSNNFSLEQRLQSEDRCHRIGQKRSVTYVDLRAPKTIDDKIVRALRAKKDIADALTSDGWRRFLDGSYEDD